MLEHALFQERHKYMITTQEILLRAKKVSQNAPLGEETKNNALKAMAQSLLENCDSILKANELFRKRRYKIRRMVRENVFPHRHIGPRCHHRLFAPRFQSIV